MTVLYHHLPNVFRLIDVERIVKNNPNYIEFTDDAVGWDGLKMILERTDDHGFKDETSEGKISLDFDLITGNQFIKAIYNKRGAEAIIGFQYLNKETGKIYFDSEIYFYGKPSFDSQFVKCGLAKTTFYERFRTRQDTNYDLLSDKNLDGGTIAPLNLLSVNLPNKEILENSTWQINPALTTVQNIPHTSFAISDLVVPWQIVTKEINGTQSPVAGKFTVVDGAQYGIILTGTAGISGRSFTFSGRIKFTIQILDANEVPTFGVSLMVVDPDTQEFTELFIGAGTMSSLSGNQTFEFVFSDKILPSVPSPYYVAFAIRFSDSGENEGALYAVNVIYDLVSSLSCTETTQYPDSQSRIVKIYEALDKSIEQITGELGALRSNFFGRTDILYGEDGCGSGLGVSSGKQIRNFPDAGLETSWKDIFTDSLKPLYNLGMGFEVETDTQGEKKTVIRVEEAKYFYNDTVVYRFEQIRNYREEVWDETIYNEIVVGFDKYLEEELNTLDSVHTVHNYLTPIQRHKNKLSIIVKAIMDGYAIEYTRREQFSQKPTTSWKYDDNLFFLQTVDGGGLSPYIDGYIGPASFQLYTVSAGYIHINFDVLPLPDIFYTGRVKVSITRFDKHGQPRTPIIGDLFGRSYNSEVGLTELIVSGSFTTANTFADEFVAIYFHTQLPYDLRIETDEPFESVEKIISPETYPNLRHTPKSILLRYAMQLKSGLYFETATKNIKNTFVKHNGDLKTTLKSDEQCLLGRSISQQVHEGGDLQIFEAGSDQGHFIPEKMLFDATLHWESYELIKSNRYGLFECVVPNGAIISGNLDRFAYTPGNQIEVSVVLLKRQ